MMGKSDTRGLALSVLQEVLEEGRLCQHALRRHLEKQSGMSRQERAFATYLVECTLEHCVQADYVLDRVASRGVHGMKPLLRNLLRLGSCQILFMDGVPDHAAIHASVELLKRRRMGGLCAFANAVLRRIAGEREALCRMLSEDAPAHVRVSLPEWIYQGFAARYGTAEADRIGAYFLAAGKSVSLYSKDGRQEEVKGEGRIQDLEAFRAGEWMVQDPASRQVGQWADPQPGAYVVDVCASPGGKSCHIALLLGGSGTVDARDLTEEKRIYIEENAKRLRLRNLHSKVWDARVPDPALMPPPGEDYGKADLLICDLPCSGLGVIGRKPDIAFHASREGIMSLQKLQREILQSCYAYLKQGGRMLYSTCTLTKEENEDNAAWIAAHLPMEFLREETLLPGRPSDGFYLAEFRRR